MITNDTLMIMARGTLPMKLSARASEKKNHRPTRWTLSKHRGPYLREFLWNSHKNPLIFGLKVFMFITPYFCSDLGGSPPEKPLKISKGLTPHCWYHWTAELHSPDIFSPPRKPPSFPANHRPRRLEKIKVPSRTNLKIRSPFWMVVKGFPPKPKRWNCLGGDCFLWLVKFHKNKHPDFRIYFDRSFHVVADSLTIFQWIRKNHGQGAHECWVATVALWFENV